MYVCIWNGYIFSYLSLLLRMHRLTRVTGLGESSPIGRLFPLCSYFVSYRSSPNTSATSFRGKSCGFILTKNEFGYFFGDAFAHSSGHPATRVPSCIFNLLSNHESTVASWFIFKQKFPIWVHFWGPWNGKGWQRLWLFGTFYGRSEIYLQFGIFSLFWVNCVKKSGNPARERGSCF
jgi:hypothetical protein